MRSLPAIAWGLILLALAGRVAAAEPEFPREQHAWARFATGSWKRVRVTTETFDPLGKLTGVSITETKTTLTDVSDESFTLRVESTTDVAGKRIVARPSEIKQRFNGAVAGQTAERRSLGQGQLVIDGKTYPCSLQQFDVVGPTGKTVTKTHYCESVEPFVLRRESSILDPANRVTSKSLLEVTALGKPYHFLSETHSTASVKLVSTHLAGREETTAVNALEVPGGIVAHDSRELDASGRLVSHSKLELLDYEAWHEVKEAREPRFRLLPRLRDGFRPMSFRSDSLNIVHTERGWHLFGGPCW